MTSNEEITIAGTTYKVFQSVEISADSHPATYAEGYRKIFWATRKSGSRVYSFNLLNNGQYTRPRTL